MCALAVGSVRVIRLQDHVLQGHAAAHADARALGVQHLCSCCIGSVSSAGIGLVSSSSSSICIRSSSSGTSSFADVCALGVQHLYQDSSSSINKVLVGISI